MFPESADDGFSSELKKYAGRKGCINGDLPNALSVAVPLGIAKETRHLEKKTRGSRQRGVYSMPSRVCCSVRNLPTHLSCSLFSFVHATTWQPAGTTGGSWAARNLM